MKITLTSYLSRSCAMNNVRYVDNLFSIQRPGVGLVLVYMSIEGFVLFILTLIIEVCNTTCIYVRISCVYSSRIVDCVYMQYTIHSQCVYTHGHVLLVHSVLIYIHTYIFMYMYYSYLMHMACVNSPPSSCHSKNSLLMSCTMCASVVREGTNREQ